jgi:hypothetical protein
MGIIMSSLRCCILRASVQSTLHPVNYNTQTLGKYISSQVVLIIKHQNILSQMARGPFSLQSAREKVKETRNPKPGVKKKTCKVKVDRVKKSYGASRITT